MEQFWTDAFPEASNKSRQQTSLYKLFTIIIIIITSSNSSHNKLSKYTDIIIHISISQRQKFHRRCKKEKPSIILLQSTANDDLHHALLGCRIPLPSTSTACGIISGFSRFSFSIFSTRNPASRNARNPGTYGDVSLTIDKSSCTTCITQSMQNNSHISTKLHISLCSNSNCAN